MTKQFQQFRLIGLVTLTVLLIAIISLACGTAPEPTDFLYAVQVLAKDTGEAIQYAEVKIDIGRGRAPLRSITDAEGYARISIEDTYVSQPAVLTVEANEYERHIQQIDLIKGNPTQIIRLEPIDVVVDNTITPTTPIDTPTLTPINTPTPPDTSVPPTDTPAPTLTPTSTPTPTITPTPTPTLTPPPATIVDSIIHCTDNGGGGTEIIPVEPPRTVARIRIDMDIRATDFGYSLWEVEVYGPDTGDTNLAIGGQAVASSAQDSFGCEGCFADKAIDGYGEDDEMKTRWSSDWSDPQWLEITLPGLQVVNRIVLKWEAAYAREYCVTVAERVTSTSKPTTCPYQADTDGATITQLIQAEAEAVNNEDISIIQAIFAGDATIRRGDTGEAWNDPITYYMTLFNALDFTEATHYGIQPAGTGITETVAYFTSGSRITYGPTGETPVFQDNLPAPPAAPSTPYGSEHWVLRKNSAGCWVITEFAFNAGHIPFLPATPSSISTLTSASFQNFEEDNGTSPGAGNYFWDAWFTTCSFSDAQVHEGTRAVHCEAHAEATGNPGDHGGTMGINPASSDPIDLSSAATISVWVYDTQGDNSVELKLRDNNDVVSNGVWSTAEAVKNMWTEITWPLSEFTSVDKGQIKNIELYEWSDGIYYFDAVTWR